MPVLGVLNIQTQTECIFRIEVRDGLVIHLAAHSKKTYGGIFRVWNDHYALIEALPVDLVAERKG